MSRSGPRPRRLPWIAGLAAGAAIAVSAAWLLRRPAGALRPGSWRGANVLFVTIDTLRADRVPAWGGKDVATPAIDGLAARGALFERCFAATPLTLPSHTTIFSGTLPVRHGVRDNGSFTVPPELPLLPERFRARGYATAAFVGAFVLDSRWKLDRGFDSYFDQFDTRKATLISIGDIERPAAEVVDAAVAWLDRRPAKPFFVWVHLYDPHAPYAPPPPYAEEYADRPYLGEIAYVDSQLARLLGALAERGLSERTAIVLAGDHGEGLGDHEEDGHGFFVYQETLHVPLLFASPGAGKPRRARDVVSLADVTPTVAALAGLDPPAGIQGRSLLPLLAGRALPDRPAYAETYYPSLHFGWSPLASIQDGRWKLIESPDPELYDLSADPAEKTNLAARDRDRYLTMKRRLTSLVGEWGKSPLAARSAVDDPEAVRKLASLGYLTGANAPPAGTGGAPLPSPRAKIGLYRLLNRARTLAPKDPRSAEAMLREVLAADPEVVDAMTALATLYFGERRNREAIPLLEQAVRRRPSDATLAVTLGSALAADGRVADARKFLESRVANGLEDARLHFLLGAMAESRGERPAADAWFARGVAREPRSAPWHAAMAEIFWKRGDLDGAEREAAAALAADPRAEGAHFVRAAVLERRGDEAGAFEEYGREIAVEAVDERSFAALARLAQSLGRGGEEAALLDDAIARHPDTALPRLYRARGMLERSERPEDAVRLAESALELSADDRQKAFACFLLADLYSRLGETGRSADFAARGKAFARGAR